MLLDVRTYRCRPGTINAHLSASVTPDSFQFLQSIFLLAAIVLGGLAGAVIGHTLVDLQCEGDCALPLGLGVFFGAVVAAGGMSIVAVLVLRALGEWREVEQRERTARR